MSKNPKQDNYIFKIDRKFNLVSHSKHRWLQLIGFVYVAYLSVIIFLGVRGCKLPCFDKPRSKKKNGSKHKKHDSIENDKKNIFLGNIFTVSELNCVRNEYKLRGWLKIYSCFDALILFARKKQNLGVLFVGYKTVKSLW